MLSKNIIINSVKIIRWSVLLVLTFFFSDSLMANICLAAKNQYQIYWDDITGCNNNANLLLISQSKHSHQMNLFSKFICCVADKLAASFSNSHNFREECVKRVVQRHKDNKNHMTWSKLLRSQCHHLWGVEEPVHWTFSTNVPRYSRNRLLQTKVYRSGSVL